MKRGSWQTAPDINKEREIYVLANERLTANWFASVAINLTSTRALSRANMFRVVTSWEFLVLAFCFLFRNTNRFAGGTIHFTSTRARCRALLWIIIAVLVLLYVAGCIPIFVMIGFSSRRSSCYACHHRQKDWNQNLKDCHCH